ncbi:MAG: DoxX family protein [Parachlamydiaceae bacterium]|nr:DoxX family protein [Parachlamydiaceae bacterium]
MKLFFAYAMGAFYILAGFMHFVYPASYLKIMPKMLPYPLMLVYLSGVAEIICGVGLLFNETRVLAAWATIALLLAIFPANINMAMNPEQFGIAPWILYLRLPLQFLFIWMAYLYTK